MKVLSRPELTQYPHNCTLKMFEKSLQDMVKGIRNAGNDATAYTAKCIQEIKEELKSKDVTIKAQALQKLIYVSILASIGLIEFMEISLQSRSGDIFGIHASKWLRCCGYSLPSRDPRVGAITNIRSFAAEHAWP